MKIASISASEVPSSKANSIQVMKACQALVQAGHQVELLVPGDPGSTDHRSDFPGDAGGTDHRSDFPATKGDQPLGAHLSQPDLASFYGLATPFPVTWLPASPRLRRYDFSWKAVQHARRTGAEAVYI
jgi:hypothetical protein